MCVYMHVNVTYHSYHHCTGSKLCIKSSVSYDCIMSMFDSTVGTVSVHVDIWAITNWLLMYRSVYLLKDAPRMIMNGFVCKLLSCLRADVPSTNWHWLASQKAPLTNWLLATACLDETDYTLIEFYYFTILQPHRVKCIAAAHGQWQALICTAPPLSSFPSHFYIMYRAINSTF